MTPKIRFKKAKLRLLLNSGDGKCRFVFQNKCNSYFKTENSNQKLLPILTPPVLLTTHFPPYTSTLILLPFSFKNVSMYLYVRCGLQFQYSRCFYSEMYFRTQTNIWCVFLGLNSFVFSEKTHQSHQGESSPASTQQRLWPRTLPQICILLLLT